MISPYPVPSLQCLAVQYRLIAALDRLESDCPVKGYPFISDDYRDSALMVYSFLITLYPPGNEIRQECERIIMLLQEAL